MKGQNHADFTASPCFQRPRAFGYSGDVNICDMATTFIAPRMYFAENGRTLCEAAVIGAFKNYPVCLDIQTGKTIAEFRGVDGGAPASASARDSRMVLSKLNYLPSGLGLESYSGTVVWDFRAGTEVAA